MTASSSTRARTSTASSRSWWCDSATRVQAIPHTIEEVRRILLEHAEATPAAAPLEPS